MTGRLAGKKVAVVVHNDVVSDARILKEVASLAREGAVIDVYGCRTKADKQYPSTVPGARSLTLVDVSTALPTSKNTYTTTDRILFPILNVANTLRGGKRSRKIRLAAAAAAFVYVTALALIPTLAMRLAMLGAAIVALVALRLFRRQLRTWAAAVYEKISPYVLPAHRYSRYHMIADALASAIDARNYEFIHCHDLIALICGARLRRSNPGLKMIWDAHEFYEHVAGYTEQDRRRVRKIIAENVSAADSMITISESFADYYGREFGIKRPHVVMNATVDTEQPGYDGRLHAACGLRPDQKILLFQGGLAPHRGIGQLLTASADLPDDWSVVFMGSGKLAAEIASRAAELRPSRPQDQSVISLIPPAPHAELAEWTSGATLGIIPYENTSLNHLYCTPNKIWEYPNAQVPILATDLVEMGNIIREWKTGVLLPRDFDAQDIVKAVKGLNEQHLNDMRSACDRFSSAMSWAKFEGALYDAYK